MKMRMIPVWFAVAFVVMLPAIGASNAVEIDTDDIGGVVRSAAGPEAGVWVIAETSDLPTPYVKIVVTDDAGCYVLPDLLAGDYSVLVRGYGLVDSNLVTAVPGGEFVFLRVPYLMGFYTRSVGARIDDPDGGWKGRGMWTSYQEVPLWHIESGEGTFGKVAKFQARPDPLAH
jgi:hypothetical protein